MAADHHPRYVVRSITGHNSLKPGSYKATTDYWIADRWYCWREVEHFPARDGNWRVSGPLVRLAAAEVRCAELNAEHDAWLAAG
jgi:hypothetical protein